MQAEHPLAWTEEQMVWLEGSPMASKLRARQGQVTEDTEALRVAGANNIAWPEGDAGALVTERSMKWAASTLLSRAFNLEIPTQSISGVHLPTLVAAALPAAAGRASARAAITVQC